MADSVDFDYGIHYRQWHDESDEHADQMIARVIEDLGPHLPANRRGSTLEIGCGMGFAMMALGRAGFKSVLGVDIDRSQIEACQRRNLNVQLISDLEQFLAEHPNEYQLVVMMDVLEHIPVASQVPVLKAVLAAMKPGGRLIVQVPNASSILAGRWRYVDFTHTSSFTEHSVRFAMLSAGFACVTVPTHPVARPSFRPHRLFTREGRHHLAVWVVRWFWKKVLEIELGAKEAAAIPLGLNLLAIADKAEKAG